MTLPHRPSALRDRLDGPHPPRAADPPIWVSISAYARLYGLTRHTVYRLIHSQRVETYRVFRLVRIRNQPPHAPSLTVSG